MADTVSEVTFFAAALLKSGSLEKQSDGIYSQGPGGVSAGDYKIFWERLGSDPTATSAYATALIAWVLGVLTGMDSKMSVKELVDRIATDGEFVDVAKKQEVSPEKRRMFETVVNTLNFISYFVEYDVNSPIFRKALNRWFEYRNGRDLIDEVMRRFQGPRDDNPLMLVEQCSAVSCAQGLVPLPGGVPTDVDARELGAALASSVLEGLMTTGQNRKAICENILLFLKHPGITAGRLLSLMYMIRQLLRVSFAVPQETLLALFTTAKGFFLWPLPYGSVAQALLLDIVRELRAPGAAWRDSFFELYGQNLTDGLANSNRGLVHVIANNTEPNMVLFRTALETRAAEVPSLLQLKYLFVRKALAAMLDGVDADALGLASCSLEDVSALFETTRAVLLEAESIREYAEANAFLVDRLGKVRDRITTMAPSASAPAVVPPCEAATLNYDFFSIDEPEALRMADPGAGPLEHVQSSAMPYLERLLLTHAQPAAAAAAPAADMADDDAALLDEDVKSRELVRVLVCGGDTTVLSVAAGYAALRSLRPELFHGLDVRFYLLPIGRENNLARFLGAYDGWYARHQLLLPQALGRVIPHPAEGDDICAVLAGGELDVSAFRGGVRGEEAPTRPAIEAKLPAEVFADEIERLMLNAPFVVPVFVYHCEVWVSPQSKGGETLHRTIPFVQRIEIGINAAARSFRAAKKLGPNVGLDDVTAHKQFKYGGVELTMAFSEMSMAGLARPGPALPPKSYWSVVVGNVAQPGGKGCVPHCKQEALELYTMDYDTGKRLLKGKSTVTEGERTYHVGTVELQSKDAKKQFGVVIDGELFEPVDKLRITPCIVDGEHVAFPINGYFPCDLAI